MLSYLYELTFGNGDDGDDASKYEFGSLVEMDIGNDFVITQEIADLLAESIVSNPNDAIWDSTCTFRQQFYLQTNFLNIYILSIIPYINKFLKWNQIKIRF